MPTERRRRARSWMSSLVACAALAACNGTTSYLDATGTTGHSEAVLGRWLTAVACAVVVLVSLAVLGGIARHRGEDNVPRPGEGNARLAARKSATVPRAGDGAGDGDGNGGARHGHRREIRSGLRWIYIGIAATVVILLATFAGTMVTLQAATRMPAHPALELDVTGHQWWWEVRYSDPTHPDLAFVTANEVHLPVGEPVRVRVQSADVIHSFWLPQIAGKLDVIPGQVNETWIEARQAGTSRGTCGEYCGLQHATMAVVVTAESPARFDAWARARRAEAAAPTTPDAQAGSVVFARSCGACHTVAGTGALGRVGPDLTHVASRPYIGAGALENTPGNLARWIRHAPDVKQGSRMPEMPLDDAELRSVVAYLQTLH